VRQTNDFPYGGTEIRAAGKAKKKGVEDSGGTVSKDSMNSGQQHEKGWGFRNSRQKWEKRSEAEKKKVYLLSPINRHAGKGAARTSRAKKKIARGAKLRRPVDIGSYPERGAASAVLVKKQ